MVTNVPAYEKNTRFVNSYEFQILVALDTTKFLMSLYRGIATEIVWEWVLDNSLTILGVAKY